MSEWHEDAQQALKYSSAHPRGTAPPHWLRCNFMRDGQRCIKIEGHDKEHEAPRPELKDKT